MAKVTIKMNKAIQHAVDKATPTTLMEAGKYVKGIARKLIPQRRDPNKKAKPGKPVHSHSNAYSSGFKKTIVYAMESDNRSVLVGPQLVRSDLSEIAKTHEFGGTRRVRDVDPELASGTKIGKEAPVTLNHVTSFDSILKRDYRKDPRSGRGIVWIRIRTKTQREHSNRLQKRMIKKYSSFVMKNYPARPYMRPSLILATPKLSMFWSRAVRA